MSVLLSTAEFANRFKVKPESVRHSLCTRGHYLGLRPRKLPNGRLMWSAKDADQLLNGGTGTSNGEARR